MKTKKGREETIVSLHLHRIAFHENHDLSLGVYFAFGILRRYNGDQGILAAHAGYPCIDLDDIEIRHLYGQLSTVFRNSVESTPPHPDPVTLVPELLPRGAFVTPRHRQPAAPVAQW